MQRYTKPSKAVAIKYAVERNGIFDVLAAHVCLLICLEPD